MIPAAQHLERLNLPAPAHTIYQPVFAGNPPRPPASQVLAQGFRLAGPAKGVPSAFLNEQVDALYHFGIFALPGAIFVPCLGIERNLHG